MRPFTLTVHLLYMAGFAQVFAQPNVVRDLAKGRRAAQESIYRDFSKPVYSMALQILQDVQLAEDVTHDTFVDVFKKTSKLKNHSSFKGWIRKIAVNRCLMTLRSRTYRNSLTEDLQTLTENPESIDHESAIDIEHALQELAPTTRMIVWLYIVEGYTHGEIGELFEKSPSYSKSQVSRALVKLRDSKHGNPVTNNHSTCSATGIR